MTRDRKLLMLLGLLMAYGLFVAECRYHQHEDAATTETRHRHRHRHESSSSSRRKHHEIDRRGGWQEDYDADSDEPSPTDEDDYDAQSYYNHPRSHHRSAQRSYHSRAFEPRYAPRHHVGGYHARGWYDEDNNDRRRIQPSRYNAKNHRYRGWTHYRPAAYSRNREVSDYDYDDDTREDYKRHRYENGGVTRKNFRRHNSGRDWRYTMTSDYFPRGARKHRLEVVNRDSWNWRRRSNSSDTYRFSKSDDTESEEDEDYEDHGGLEEDDRDDEDELWKDVVEDEDNEENEDDDIDDDDDEDDDDDDDNDFYKSEAKPLLKTYDDIIRRLTSDDPTTPRSSTVKRDYRNLPKYARRDRLRMHKSQINNSRSKPVDFLKMTNASHSRSDYFANKQTANENSTVKFGGATERKSHIKATGLVRGNDRHEAKNTSKINDIKTGSPTEQDYDEYLNTSDNEKEDDLVKAGVADGDSDMQADVTNTDYNDDDNGNESETPADITTSTPATTTKPVVQHYDYKDRRSYESGTGSQYNGYQAKNDYPPMSAHSVHKWQLLGTRESVKEARSNMQLLQNKTEINEAMQHSRKVNKEGICQWPRVRLIPVREVYPNPSISYMPHCAMLHRCSDDTGCCRSETYTCVPKHTQRVELSFYAFSVTGVTMIEKLSFYNHTKCECKEKQQYNATNEKEFPDQRVSRHHHHHSSSSPPENTKNLKKPCRCPSQFTPRIMQGVCQCHCLDSNHNCFKTRRGKGFLSLADRICIQENKCAMPHCEFGDYIQSQGKCPLKKDTFNAMMTRDYRTTLQHRPRS